MEVLKFWLKCNRILNLVLNLVLEYTPLQVLNLDVYPRRFKFYIPNYSILQLSLASLSSYSQGTCPSHSTPVANPNFWYPVPVPPFPRLSPLFGGTRPRGKSTAERRAARIGHERLPVGLSYWLCLPTLSTFPRLASRNA